MKRFIANLLVAFLLFSFIGVLPVYADEPQFNVTNVIDEYVLRQHFNNKEYEECIKEANEILARDNSLMPIYLYKSLSYYYINDYQNFYDTLLAQLKLNPNNQPALYTAAYAASLLGKEQESVDFLKKILQMDITHKSKIKQNKNFDALKNNDAYKKLMDISVIVGGELLDLDVAPIMMSDRTLLPLRAIFESLGANVTWDDGTQTASATKGDSTLDITVNQKIAKVNGVNTTLDVPATLLNDRVLVPVRFVAESLGAHVDWDQENEAVSIFTKAPEGTLELKTAKNQLTSPSMIAVSMINGINYNPYTLDMSEGICLIIAKDKKALDMINSMSADDRAKYVATTVYENYALIKNCNPVHAKVVYDGKAYYEGDFRSDNKDAINLTYYEKGKPVNVVKQYKANNNYKDFYLLPTEEQVSDKIDATPNATTAPTDETVSDTDNQTTDQSTIEPDTHVDDTAFSNTAKRTISFANDDQGIKLQLHNDIRYNFEQDVLPNEIFKNEQEYANLIKNDPSAFTAKITDAWNTNAKNYLSETSIDIENNWDTAEEKESTINDMIDSYELDFDSNINLEVKKIDDNTYFALLDMANINQMLVSSYIGIVYKEGSGFSYFTLEQSFDDYFLMCDIKADGSHENYGPLDNNKTAFVNKVKKLLN